MGTDEFKKNCLYVPIAPPPEELDIDDPEKALRKSKSPNTNPYWSGDTVDTWSSNGDGLYRWSEVQNSDWNRWGIVEYKGDKRLLILDIDLYKMDDKTKDVICDADIDTRLHSSQSGGFHVFYLIDESELKPYYDDGDLKHKLPVKLKKHIDDKLNGYVLSPMCEGYKVEHDIYPKEITIDEIPKEWLKDDSSKDYSNNITTSELTDEELKDHLELAKSKDDKFKHLFEGDFRAAGYDPDDRSKAEYVLADKIGFWFGRDESTIRELMDRSAAPKWNNRSDESYRNSVIKDALTGDVYNLNQSEQPSKDDSDVKKIPSIVTDELIIEQVKKDNNLCYAVWNGEEIDYKDEIKIDGQKYKPISDDLVKDNVVKLAEEPQKYNNINSLIEEIKQFIHRWLDISNDFEEMAAWYVLLSWTYDKFSTIPYLRFHGDWGTGKTRAVKTIGGLCYKALDTAGATTSAAVERMVTRWGGCMLMNEADFFNSDASSQMVKVLNEGFESDNAIVKAHKEDQEGLVTTNPYSPKILATRQKWKDQALESRCLTETMHETQREDILPILTDEFHNKQQELRNKLLMFRFKNYRKFDENKVKEIWSEIKQMDLERRLVQATINFSVLFYNDKEMFERYTQFIQSRQKELKKQRAATFDGGIAKAIYELIRDGQDYITSSEIAEHLENKQNYDEVRPQTVGKHLGNLGLSTTSKWIDDGTKRILEGEAKEIMEVLKRYVPDFDLNITAITCITGITDTVRNSTVNVDSDNNSSLDSFNNGQSACNGRNKRNACNVDRDNNHTLKREIIDTIESYNSNHSDQGTPLSFIVDMISDESDYNKDEIKNKLDHMRETGDIFTPESERYKLG